MDWARILAYVTGTVDQELLARIEYLAAENRILKAQLKGRLKLSDAERATLAEIGHRLGRKALAEVATVARPDTILAWYRKLVARKFDGSKARRSPGRPRIKREVEQLIVRMAKENHDWGYDRIVGALANLGYKVCDQTVGNVLQRHGLPPAPERKRTTTWSAFIRTHLALLAGTDFFTAEVLTLRGLVTYYVLFFIHLESRRVDIAGITVHPDEPWMQQIARNVTMEGCGALRDCRYLLHDRDTQVYPVLPGDHRVRSGRAARAACAQPEPECLCGALGQVGEGGVPVQGGSVRRALAAASAERICRALPCRAQSPGEGQRPAVPSGYGHLPRRSLCDVVKDWAGCCVITIKRRRDQRQGRTMKWDMPIRPIESGPLTDREIEELDAFLLAEDGLENPMDFYTFDGFICAVLSGPNTIMPSEWLRWVWDQEKGEQPPEFTSEKQAKRILSLLIGHANVLAFTLIHGPQHYEPRFYSHKIPGNSVPVDRRMVLWLCQGHRARS